MNIESKLKEKLRLVKTNNYDISKEEIQILVPQMLENLGSTDSELRDKLIYTIFYFWIMGEKFTTDELRQLLNTSLNEFYLFYEIGDMNTVSVFRRSFSVLIVAVILNYNQNKGFLSDEEIIEVYNKLIEYFKMEKDYRGFDKDYGWAHSIAHAADALDEIVKYHVIDDDKLKYILLCIKEKIQIDDYTYINGEDERLVLAVYSLLKRDVLSFIEIEKWIDGIVNYSKKNVYPEDDIILMNVKSFLRSLYFRIVHDVKFKRISLYIINKLDSIDEYKIV